MRRGDKILTLPPSVGKSREDYRVCARRLTRCL
jgi:hypothetical protein